MKYLGTPLGVNSKRIDTWKPIINRIENKLSTWKCKFLSKPGRLVHIKLVLNSLPLYYLGLLKMPKVVARKIIALRSQFFWRTNDGGKGISMVKWSLIQEPKQLGGLGVEDPFAENMTLLFKW